MNTVEIAAFAGFGTSLVAIIGLIWRMAFKLSDIQTKVNFLWWVHQQDTIRNRQVEGMVAPGSVRNTQRYLTVHGGNVTAQQIEAWKGISDRYRERLPDDEALALAIARRVPKDTLRLWAANHGLAVSDLMVHAIATIHEIHTATREGYVDQLPYPMED